MPTEAEVLQDWRYCHLTGSATVTKLGNIVLVCLEDQTVNPEKDVLKFKDITGSINRLFLFKSVPGIDWSKGITQKVVFEELILAFDEVWFEFTKANGFLFKKEDGSDIKEFMDLEKPTAADMPKMNPIVP